MIQEPPSLGQRMVVVVESVLEIEAETLDQVLGMEVGVHLLELAVVLGLIQVVFPQSELLWEQVLLTGQEQLPLSR